jgi:hypothetical protein
MSRRRAPWSCGVGTVGSMGASSGLEPRGLTVVAIAGARDCVDCPSAVNLNPYY